ncbi:hypothetical protein HK405_007918 [Cladochytrium tenue]|nr:hypothetical protein HK405_007918 [Cladochytrium tenue]
MASMPNAADNSTEPATNTLILANVDFGQANRSTVNDGSDGDCTLMIEGALGKDAPKALRVIPLRSLKRIIVIFRTGADAEMARGLLELKRPMELGEAHRVFYGEPTDLALLDARGNAAPTVLLQVPPIERNFLISPPGSPPIGWVQVREGGPNPGGHAQALADALARLTADDDHAGGTFYLDGGGDDGERTAAPAAPHGFFLARPVEVPDGVPMPLKGASYEPIIAATSTAPPPPREVRIEGDWHHVEAAAAAVAVASSDASRSNNVASSHVLTFGPAPRPLLTAAGASLPKTRMPPAWDTAAGTARGDSELEADSTSTAEAGGADGWHVSLPVVVIEDHDASGAQQVEFKFDVSDLTDVPAQGPSAAKERTALPPPRSIRPC